MDGVKPRLPSAAPFNSAPLVRCLAGLGVADVTASPLTLAERWSPWLAWTDAIALSAVLGSGRAAGDAPARPAAAAAAPALWGACSRLRQDLSQAIASDPVLAPAWPCPAAPAPGADPPRLDPAELPALRRQYQAHQQAMDQRVGALRAQVRAVLAGQAGRLGQLAALDAVLDGALATRQRQLLAQVPGWLDRHFKRQPLPLAAALAELQRLLLAELDLRLQPVEGLIETLAGAAGAQP